MVISCISLGQFHERWHGMAKAKLGLIWVGLVDCLVRWRIGWVMDGYYVLCASSDGGTSDGGDISLG